MKRHAPLLIVIALALLTLAFNLRHLGHARLTTFDESFHAVVARNLLRHPLHPTLYEQPAFTYHPLDWGHSHTWLHKGTLPLWMIALSYKLLGVSTFALRVPSALLTALCVVLTYRIGTLLCDRETGVVAAAFQAVLPAMPFLTQGYMFSDHIDVLLLALVELGVLFLLRAARHGSWRDVVLVGACQGLAYLTKTYLAFILTGLAVAALLLPFLQRKDPQVPWRFRVRHLAVLLLVTALTAGPWTWYCYTHYRTPFLLENGLMLRHLNANVERWGAPWEQVIFVYLPELSFTLLAPSFVALAVVAVRAAKCRDVNLLFLVAWAFGVLLPHLLAHSKTPSATLIGLPALLLILAYVVVRGARGERWALATWAGAALIVLAVRPAFRFPSYNDPKPAGFVEYLHAARGLTVDMIGGLALAGALALLLRATSVGRRATVAKVVLLLAVVATADLLRRDARVCWAVANRRDRDHHSFADTARFARTLPPDAVLLFDEADDEVGAHVQLMYLCDRASYSLDDVADALDHEPDGGDAWQTSAREGNLGERLAARAGSELRGRPVYLVSGERLPMRPAYVSAVDGKVVYRVDQERPTPPLGAQKQTQRSRLPLAGSPDASL